MADIGGLISATLSGGAAGILGQVINRGFGIFEAAQKRKDAAQSNAHELLRWANEKDLLKIQMEQQAESHEQDLETTSLAGSWQGLTESIRAESAVGASYPWVNAVRSLVRPVLTFGSQAGVMLIFFCASPGVRELIQQDATETWLFIATATTLWWFGERAERKHQARR